MMLLNRDLNGYQNILWDYSNQIYIEHQYYQSIGKPEYFDNYWGFYDN
jgi:hypothetical protein